MPEKLLVDGVSAVPRGMNGGSSPLLVGVDQFVFSSDATIRSEHLSPRPTWKLIARSQGKGKMEDAIASGRFQDAIFYRGSGVNGDRLVIVSGGRVFEISPPDWKIREYPRQDGQPWFHPRVNQTFSLQAERYLILQDGIHRPVIYEPGSARQAADDEVRTGTVMAYVNGRLWTVLRDGRSFVAGDIARGPSGTPGEQYIDAVLKVTENDYLAEGGSFAVPDGSGVITAMAVPAQDGTAPGTGFIVLFTTDGAYQLNLPVDRDSWKSLRSPAVAKVQANRGCVGPDAFALVNGDVVFRATDGVRSLKLAQRSFEATWINSAISHEVESILKYDDPRLLYGSSAVEHERRWLLTCWGRPDNLGTVYDGILSLQLDPVSAMFSDEAPAWEGVWTGLRTHKLLNAQIAGQDVMIAVVRTQDEGIAVMQLVEDGIDDQPTPTTDSPVRWSVETREMFTETALVTKRIELLELELFDIRTDVDIAVYLRAGSFGNWMKWGDLNVRASTGVCAFCDTITTGNAQARTELRLGIPPDDCVDSWGKELHTGYTWTLRFEFSGFARVRAMRIRAKQWAKEVTVECVPETVDRREEYCGRNDRDNLII